MARTVLDRGITGACSICWLIAIFVMVIVSQLMTSFKLKSEARGGVRTVAAAGGAGAPRGAPRPPARARARARGDVSPLSLPSPAFRPSLAQGGARGGKLRGLSPACGELTMRCTPARAGPGAATRTRGG